MVAVIVGCAEASYEDDSDNDDWEPSPVVQLSTEDQEGSDRRSSLRKRGRPSGSKSNPRKVDDEDYRPDVSYTKSESVNAQVAGQVFFFSPPSTVDLTMVR
jgi:hypothetical protein